MIKILYLKKQRKIYLKQCLAKKYWEISLIIFAVATAL